MPDLPNFSHFHDAFRDNAEEPAPPRATCAPRSSWRTARTTCEHLKLYDPNIDERMKNGPELVSANFVIPYPPGFPIMVPGQVITQETIDVHPQARCEGDPRLTRRPKGSKLLKADAVAAKMKR